LSTDDTSAAWPQADLREIHVFLTLAEELHFGRTAERLGIAPSYVSQTIRTLETRVDGKLFDRTSRRVSCGPHWLQITRTFKARHPACELELIDTKFDPNYLDLLRAGRVDLVASRLPLADPDLLVGPVLSRERRVLLVAKGDALASRENVCVEDFADRVVSDAPALPREMIDAWCPPVTPSGRRFRRKDIRSFEDCLMLVAAGELVHPAVASFLQYYVDDGVVAVPIRDLPPSETALVWLSADRSQKVIAFARTAAEILASCDPALKPSATKTARSAGEVA
jgi:DNA-binding transcriptional LysR family regulator